MKKLHCRILCALLSLILLLGISPITATAAVNPAVQSGDNPYGFAAEVDVDGLKAHIEAQIASCPNAIAVSSFNIAETNENLNAIAELLLCRIPTAFHVKTFTYWGLSGQIYAIYPQYLFDSATYSSMLAECDAAAEAMIADLKDNDTLTDIQKALLVHDRVAEACVYKTIEDQDSVEHAYAQCMYGALVAGYSVCEGYAGAFTYVLDKLGIPSYMILSTDWSHAWSVLNIDGKYYHVDVTWDDPMWNGDYNAAGTVYHDYFMVSTAYLTANNHPDNYIDAADDTSYDSAFWQNSYNGFQLVDGTVYYYDNRTGQIKTYDGDVVHTITGAAGNVYARFDTDGRVLFFTTSNAIYAYDPVADSRSLVYRPDPSLGSIYGMRYSDGVFTIETNTDPYLGLDTLVTTTYSYTTPEPEPVFGDVDGDGQVTTNDYLLLRLHCKNGNVFDEAGAASADINGDGIISSADCLTVNYIIKQG